MRTPILLASNNSHKLHEVRQILGDRYEIFSPADLGLSFQVDETGETFRDNAILKAEAGARLSEMLTMADDSGLMIDALKGEPGVRSARYGGPGRSDAGRVALVLDRLQGVPQEWRTARFISVIAVAAPDQPTRAVEGVVEGEITEQPRGTGTFGYDPIFLYPPAGKTFAEMDTAEKGSVSHRGLALVRARELLLPYRSLEVFQQPGHIH